MTDKAIEYLREFQPRKALPLLKKACAHALLGEAREEYYGPLVNYAIALRGCGQVDDAKLSAYAAAKINPRRPEAWCELAQCAQDLGRFDEAPRLFQACLESVDKSGMPPSQAGEPLLGFAHCLMRLGQFNDAWPIWEAARYGRSWNPPPGLPPWRGEPDARLLVVPEGGFGDGFNFLRWIPQIQNGGTVLVWDQMLDYTRYVLSGLKHHMSIFPLSHKFQGEELARFTHVTPYMSLPVHSMKHWRDIPAPLNWEPRGRIHAPANDWIGFCWRAEENGVMRKVRSLDTVTSNRIARHLNARCERVVGLCPTGKHLYRDGGSGIPRNVVQDDALLSDWEQTALTILKCRLVVTVDTAVAHLAGSLGVPTLILVPLRSDWKWANAGCTATAFYGPNVRLFRNDCPAMWNTGAILQAIERM